MSKKKKSVNDPYANMTDEERFSCFERECLNTNAGDSTGNETVVASKFHWSDLGKTEDWWTIWIGFFIIFLAVISIVTNIFPSEGAFTYSAAKFSSWGNEENPTLFSIFSSQFMLKWLLTLVFFTFVFSVGMHFMGKDVKKFATAFPALYILASVVYILSGQVTLKQYFEYAVWALVIGLIISNFIKTPEFFKPVLQTEYYIKTGLVIMGAEVLFQNIAKFGGYGLAIAWLVTPTVIIFMWIFGTKFLKMENPRMVMVIGVATSVCGVSAAIAAAAACKARKVELTFAIGLSMIFTVIMMICMPLFIKAVGITPMVGGAWIGGTVDSTGAVVLAGEALGEIGGHIAAMVKMIQNILIGFIAFAIAVFFTTKVDRGSQREVGASEIWHRFPKFILGFVFASVFSSLILLPLIGQESTVAVIDACKTFKGWCFCLAFLSIGLESNFKEMADQMAGGKPMILYVVGQSFNLILTLLVAWVALSGNFFPIPDLSTFS